MTFNDYQEAALSTKVYGAGDEIIYPALGLANEAGEVLGNIKKMMRDDAGLLTEERRFKIAAELGDVLWYIAALAQDLDVSLDTVAEDNIAKLKDRRTRGVIHGSGDNR